MDIKTKLDVAIITGAGQGIGKKISLKIASLGIPVLCISKSNNVFETAKEIKKAGAEIRRTVDISEPVNYAVNFLLSEKCNYSGRFVHVRDNWIDYLNTDKTITNNDYWKLRRIEK
jgi:NAD(P)-dependent dehydrogenase (short-subunit alcohol dehydrogenase family)